MISKGHKPARRLPKRLCSARANTKKAMISLTKLNSRLNKQTKPIETKSGTERIVDGLEYLHNTINVVSSTFLSTNNGIHDNEVGQGQRIGPVETRSR